MINIFNFVLKNLKRRKLRSWLTIIGIIIGVFAIVSLMSLSQGLKTSINEQFGKMGANKITIESKYTTFGAETEIGLGQEDIRNLEKISDLEFVSGEVNANIKTEFNGEINFITSKGYNTENFERILEQDNFKLLKGNFFENNKSKQVIIGYDFYNEKDLFDKKININDKLEINNEKYTVIGILEDTGSSTTNTLMYFPIETLIDITESSENSVDSIIAIVKQGKDIEIVSKKIEQKLEIKRGEKDFTVSTPIDKAKDREEILNTVSIVVIGIAAISLLVGGIGIMNSMYTSVLERRKEIGVLKAIGAKRKDILKIFLLEAGLIGIVGGAIGTFLGFLVSILVKIISSYFEIDLFVSINIEIIILAIGFSFIIGLISGYLPANQASRQEAVDSLREE
ncbi:MAG: ABC transporter permease [Candidatus ainarchaeum sp.]|nr:ABC transporter permease [Candidatus ainarchaeum sp.]